MASAGTVAVESPARREPAPMPSSECPPEALRKADSLQARSSISLHAASSGDPGPPIHKRARRDAVRRVWDWLDMSLSREPSTGSAGEAVAFGQLHLCEASPATTLGTTTLDVLPGDAGEPCVSSLPDGTAGHEEGCSQKQGTCDAGSPQQHAAGNAQFEPVRTEGTALGPTSTHDSCGRPEDSAAADRSLLGANYQKQGSSRKRKHGNPPTESCPASADPPLPGDRPEAQPDAAL